MEKNDISRLDLSTEQLVDIAVALDHKIADGLKNENREIKCLPAFIPAGRLPRSGKAMVLDLGGTRLRAAVAALEGNQWALSSRPVEQDLPVRRNVPLEQPVYLNVQADLVARLAPDPDLPLGYCFSYPARPRPDGDAELINWTKEIFVPGVEGKAVGKMLADTLAEKHGIRPSSVAVINDTVASLLAGLLAAEDSDAFIGLIVGTGTNMAALMQAAAIPKLKRVPDPKALLPVNLESGNFHPPHLTNWDDLLDRDSEAPGCQRFEKAVSGAYLARLMKMICPDAPVNPANGAADLVKLMGGSQEAQPEHGRTARMVLDRSAKLTAASLAGLIQRLNTVKPRKQICIMAEGGLIARAPGYRQQVTDTLKALLVAMNLSHVKPKLVMTGHANLIGSTVAALAMDQNKRGKS